jgi:hypothetical protein
MRKKGLRDRSRRLFTVSLVCGNDVAGALPGESESLNKRARTRGRFDVKTHMVKALLPKMRDALARSWTMLSGGPDKRNDAAVEHGDEESAPHKRCRRKGPAIAVVEQAARVIGYRWDLDVIRLRPR